MTKYGYTRFQPYSSDIWVRHQYNHNLTTDVLTCIFLSKWRLPHKETAVQLPRDAGERLHASVWGHGRPRQPPRAAPLPAARTNHEFMLLLLSLFACSHNSEGFMDLLSVPYTGRGFRQCGRWVETRATYLQPGQSAASQLDRGGQPALLLLPLLHVCKHDCAESPAQVRHCTSVVLADSICFLLMTSVQDHMF